MPAGLVISAHAADFVWRAGGAIALHAAQGWRMVVVCLSLGERGESAKLWREPGMTLERVKANRRAEAEAAAHVLGAELRLMEHGDYPMRVPDDTILALADAIRELQPSFILSHAPGDPWNFDHELTRRVAQEAQIISQARGHNPGLAVAGPTPVLMYEPHQTEWAGWRPDVYLDIDAVFETKRRAFEQMGAQEWLWDYWTRAAAQRGNQAWLNGGRKIVHAEAYQRLFPQVATTLG
ncbi:PIG-L deacetylase family protein [Rubrimonas cliftonensis]|uniref:4-oxalomesaconate hydratase n=1 Tax=Rubrimonas cliftonensis TaxID=89524 RepID=A0A1H4FE52_9RHOB|nr:PIG-L deacetylase family protein [Rubrimonas cliftonensis]SEA95566.1 4-oxalomesaconate hydratase [Rubrimonas cliftonensis]